MKNFLLFSVLLLASSAVYADNVTRIGNKTFVVDNPHSFCTYNNMLWFGAHNSNQGVHLFFTDGTAEGMQASNQGFPGELENMVVADGRLYFSVGGRLYSVTGRDLELLHDFSSTTGPVALSKFQQYKHYLLFIVSDGGGTTELYAIDLFGQQINRVAALTNKVFSETWEYTVFKNKVYFPAEDANGDRELWVSDLTNAGTHILTDIYPAGTSNPFNLTVHDNRLYFSAENEPVTPNTEHHFRPWYTDGTDTGTHLLKNITPAPFYPVAFHSGNNKLFFTVTGGSMHSTLYASDGTAAGTDSLQTFLNIGEFFSYKDHVYYSANDFNEPMLWRTDGTVSGTQQFATAVDAQAYAVYNDKLYFKARVKSTSRVNVWSTDGNTVQEHLFPKTPSSPLRNANQLYRYNGGLYFNARYDSTGNTLWKLDPFPTSVAAAVKDEPAQLYPNPAKDRVTLSLPKDVRSKQLAVRMLAITGQCVSELYSGPYTPAIEFALPAVPAGLYLVEVSTDGKRVSQQRLVVQE